MPIHQINDPITPIFCQSMFFYVPFFTQTNPNQPLNKYQNCSKLHSNICSSHNSFVSSPVMNSSSLHSSPFVTFKERFTVKSVVCILLSLFSEIATCSPSTDEEACSFSGYFDSSSTKGASSGTVVWTLFSFYYLIPLLSDATD